MSRIGILALQGDFEEHLVSLRQLGVEGVQVRLPADLQGLNGLIIPGGESTTIGKIGCDLRPYWAFEKVRAFKRPYGVHALGRSSYPKMPAVISHCSD